MEWTFTKAENPKKCWVTFKIEFSFKSSTYNYISGMFFDQVVKEMIHAFEARCEKVYTNRS